MQDTAIVGKGKRILIVEDDKFLRVLLADSLRDVGYKVDSARDVKTALEFLNKYLPDLILLDLMLPDVNGFDFLEEVKRTRKLAVPVVMLSNLSGREDIDHAVELGASDFLVKANVTPGQIIRKAQSVLGRAKT